MKKIRSLTYIFFLLTAILSCSKDQDNQGGSGSKGQINIHMLSKTSYFNGRCEVDPSKSEVDAAPIIRNDEILGYSKTEHQFFVSQQAFKRLENATDKIGFVVAVNGEIIYFGIHKPMTSSSSCDQSITMSGLTMNSEYVLFINLGYPGTIQGSVIPDLRNDEKLIKVLEKQGKLR